MSSWREIKQLTVFGRTMIVNAMYFSRFRYVAQVIVPPAHVTEAIVSDAQALVWDRTPNIAQKTEYGTDRINRRWLRQGAQFQPKKQLSIGLLPWIAHLKGLQAKLLFKYIDPSRGPWKLILDEWFTNRTNLGRGGVFSTIP